MRSVQLTFDCGGTDDEWPFLREYVAPTWRRFEGSDAFHSGWFWRAGSFARPDVGELTREEHDLERLEPGQVICVLNGDVESLVDAERPRWESLQAEGLVTDWTVQWFDPTWANSHEKLRAKYGEVGGRHAATLRPLAAGLTVDYLDAVEEPLPAVGESSDENPVPMGFWALFHFLSKQSGYGWSDEIDACTKAITSRIRSLATFTSENQARVALEETIEELESLRATLET